MKKSLAKPAPHANKAAEPAVNKKIRLALDWLSTQPENSLALVDELLAKDVGNPLLWVIATKANQRLGQFFQADECVDKALKIAPDYIEAIYAKADLLYRSDRLAEAERYLTDAVTRIGKSESRPLRSLFATVLQKQKKYEHAQALYQELTDEAPDNWLYWNNLGMLGQDRSQFAAMDAAYVKSCAVTKDNPTPYFNRIVGAHYDPERSAEDILQMCRDWQQKFAPKSVVRAVAKNKSADKRLRIGLISDGLRSHPVGQMITLGLSNIPESQIEFYAYSTNYKEDHLTHRIKRMCAKWQVIEHISPVELDKIIRADQIDILFDLSGYNANSRMQTMQLAPAPVQIKWVGGLISSTGLETMDYLLSDGIETPEGSDALYTEKLIRMPDDYICYDPPFYLPSVNENPVKSNGYITFGCFNNASKINDPLLAQWAALLHRVPDSRLFLKSFNFDNVSLSEHVLSTLESHGITRDRVRIEGASLHQALLASYHDVDIALDPWPYSGGLTTCEAMAMGVPVVTLPGPTFAGRHSASHLVNAGLQELVASDWENYLDITVGLTHDLESLAIIRSNLRDILLASPVCDAQRFAKHFSEAMRAVWQRYCEGKQPEALTLSNDVTPYFEDDKIPVVLQMPKNISISENKIESNDFSFQLAGRIIVMDFGGSFTTNDKFAALTELESFFFIIMDTLGVVEEKHLPLRKKSLQHIKLHALGNGEPTPVYMCLDTTLSSTLKPLTSSNVTGSEVLVELKSQSSKLDNIHGLDKLDLLILDNKFDLTPTFEYGARILEQCLAVEVKVTFVNSHHGQMSFESISAALSSFGFVFHCFNQIEYKESGGHDIHPFITSTKMVSAKALFIPCREKLRAFNTVKNEKLAFIMHAIYGMHDVAFELLQANSHDRAQAYSNDIATSYKNAKSKAFTQKKHSLPNKLIVSLTSWHKRFDTLHLTLECLLNQTIKADKIILWIAETERHLIPESVISLGVSGIDIRYCEDIKSYKKIVPTLIEEPGSFIVTADDDLAYGPDWLEKIISSWNGDYKTVVANRAHKIRLDKSNNPIEYKDWQWNYLESSDISNLIFPTTGYGVLYPPNCFHSDVLNSKLFEELSPNADDIWLFWMCRLNGVKFKVVGEKETLREWKGTSDAGLWQTNLLKGDNDRYIKSMIAHYGFEAEKTDNSCLKEASIIDRNLPRQDLLAFHKSSQYWDDRYRLKGNSGAGSYGRLAEFKARVINDFVKHNDIQSVIEFGCGDGNQLSLANYPHYVGFDVSEHALQLCKKRFKDDSTKEFYSVNQWRGQQAELTMSLDVIYHLIEDDVFDKYMRTLFSAASRFVIIYASNDERLNISISRNSQHVYHRKFTDWVVKNMGEAYVFDGFIPNKYPFDIKDQANTLFADFYIFRCNNR